MAVVVSVTSFTGTASTRPLALTATVAELKQEIEAESGIPIPLQLLKYRGQAMADDQSFSAIGSWTVKLTLDLNPNVVLRYRIAATQCRSCVVEAKCDDTVLDIKKRLGDLVHRQSVEMRLFIDNLELAEYMTVKDIFRPRLFQLQLVLPEDKLVTVSRFGILAGSVAVDKVCTVADLQSEIAKKTAFRCTELQGPDGAVLVDTSTLQDCGIHSDTVLSSPSAMGVWAKSFSSDYLWIACDLSITSPELSVLIAKEGFFASFLTFRNRQLREERLQDVGIGPGAVVLFGAFAVNGVSSYGEVIDLVLPDEKTDVRTIKLPIAEKLAVAVDLLRLCQDGEILHDEETIDFSPASNSCKLHILYAWDSFIWVKCANSCVRFEISDFSAPVSMSGLPWSDRHLYHKGRWMHPNYPLQHYGVQPGSVVLVLDAAIDLLVSVLLPAGGHFYTSVCRGSTAKSLKEYICGRRGFDPKDTELVLEKAVLADETCLTSSTHSICLSLLTSRDSLVVVSRKGAQPANCVCRSDDTVAAAKKRVEKVLGVPATDQVFVRKEKCLSDDQPINPNPSRERLVFVSLFQHSKPCVTIKLLGNKRVVKVDNFDISVRQLKRLAGIECQHLICSNNELADEHSLRDCSLFPGAKLRALKADEVLGRIASESKYLCSFIADWDDTLSSVRKRVNHKYSRLLEQGFYLAPINCFLQKFQKLSDFGHEIDLHLLRDSEIYPTIHFPEGVARCLIDKNLTVKSLKSKYPRPYAYDFVSSQSLLLLDYIELAKYAFDIREGPLSVIPEDEDALFAVFPSHRMNSSISIFAAKMDCTGTVQAAKHNLQVVDDCSLILDDAVLRDSVSLEDCGVQSRSRLTVIRPNERLIRARTAEKSLLVPLSRQSTAGEVLKIAMALGCCAAESKIMQNRITLNNTEIVASDERLDILQDNDILVYVSGLHISPFSLILLQTTSISQLKERLGKDLGVSPEYQRLYSGPETSDLEPLAAYMRNFTASFSLLFPGDIAVLLGNTAVPILPSFTVAQIKQCLQCKDSDDLLLGDVLLGDTDTLPMYGILKEAKVAVVDAISRISLHFAEVQSVQLALPKRVRRFRQMQTYVADGLQFDARELTMTWTGEMEDDMLVSDYSNGDQMQVTVLQTESQQTLSLYFSRSGAGKQLVAVPSTASVSDFREVINDYSSVLAMRQVVLEDYNSLSFYKVSDYDTIRVPKNTEIELKIFNEYNERFRIVMKPNEFVGNIKTLVSRLSRIPRSAIRLYHGSVKLSSKESLIDYAFTNGTELKVHITTDTIKFQTAQGTEFSLVIDHSQNIAALKCSIQDRIGIEEKKQEIYYGNVLLENDRTIDSYELTNSSTLAVLTNDCMRVTVNSPLTESFYLFPSKFDTVRDFKAAIAEKTGIPLDGQKLICSLLVREGKSIAPQLELRRKGRLDILKNKSSHILVILSKDPTVHIVRVGRFDSICSLRTTAEQLFSTSPLQLLYNGVQLSETSSVQDCEIKPLSVISAVGNSE